MGWRTSRLSHLDALRGADDEQKSSVLKRFVPKHFTDVPRSQIKIDLLADLTSRLPHLDALRGADNNIRPSVFRKF